MRHFYKIFICILVSFFDLNGQTSSTCQNAQLVCPAQQNSYQASVNVGNAQPGPAYGCLAYQPNPAWFYVNFSSAGNLDMVIAGSAFQDVDFICWGPFSSLPGACNNLTSGNTIDCSYSSSPTETLNILNASAGEFYLFMVTNYSNQPQNINFTTSGSASISCLQITATPLCATGQSTINVYQQGLSNTSYTLLPGNVSSSTPSFVVSPTVSTNYSVTCSGVNSQSVMVIMTNTVDVILYPNPVLTASLSTPTICVGQQSYISVSGGMSYAWSTGSQNSYIVVSPTATTVYSVSGMNPQGCVSTVSVTQYVNLCTGIANKIPVLSLILFPNPADQVLHITGIPGGTSSTIRVSDNLGKEALIFHCSEPEVEISTSNLAPGIYLLTLAHQGGNFFAKLIIQH